MTGCSRVDFFQALLPKWQRKFGAPKVGETFKELYDRARTCERHDQQLHDPGETSRSGESQRKVAVTPEDNIKVSKGSDGDRPVCETSEWLR